MVREPEKRNLERNEAATQEPRAEIRRGPSPLRSDLDPRQQPD